MAFKGVIFDLFHTLTGVESEASTLAPTSEILGIDRDAWNAALWRSSRWRLVGEVRDPVTIMRTVAHEMDPSIAEERIVRAVEVRQQRFRNALRRIPERNLTALQRVRNSGYRLGLISNADALEIAAWNESPLDGLFDSVVFSCDVGHVKPDAQIFTICLSALGLNAQECLFVGDGGSDELIGARAVGISCVFVSGVIDELWPDKVADRIVTADHHIKWLPELLPILGIN
jgi:putative hydrolase of the HAD superfamily